ncbi:hypothetical protein ACWEIJ_34565 [Lentzea sp. NPDC004789]
MQIGVFTAGDLKPAEMVELAIAAEVFGWFGQEIEYGLPRTIEHSETLKALWPNRPYVVRFASRTERRALPH